ncbi:MAG: cohesin domain-containing protein, partial [Candidatus Jorgensenbacteria bacterium]|nr:cohesin domain-containing protein [Candidatus Jorgensenbacteria bacterium]
SPSVSLTFPASTRVAPGSEFAVSVMLASEVPVNAFDLVLTYPKELELLGFDTGGSLVNVWQAGPRVRPDRTIELVGGMATPFVGTQGRLVVLEFRAVEEGSASPARQGHSGGFEWRRTLFYTADGRGTELIGTHAQPPQIAVEAGAPFLTLAPPTDATTPALEVALVYTEEGVPLLAFDVQDDESGIAVTLLRTRRGFSWGDWQTSMNPVVLPRGVWSAELLAVNGSGGESRAMLYVWREVVRALGLILVVFTAIGTARVMYNKRKYTG